MAHVPALKLGRNLYELLFFYVRFYRTYDCLLRTAKTITKTSNEITEVQQYLKYSIPLIIRKSLQIDTNSGQNDIEIFHEREHFVLIWIWNKMI